MTHYVRSTDESDDGHTDNAPAGLRRTRAGRLAKSSLKLRPSPEFREDQQIEAQQSVEPKGNQGQDEKRTCNAGLTLGAELVRHRRCPDG